jgi:hypothetical protein
MQTFAEPFRLKVERGTKEMAEAATFAIVLAGNSIL